MAKDLRQYTIHWDTNHYSRFPQDKNPDYVDFEFFSNANGFELHEIRAVEHLDIAETYRLGQGDIIVTRIFDETNPPDDERDMSYEIKTTILEHITTQVELQCGLIPNRLSENDSDNRLKQDIFAIESWMKLYDYVNRDQLVIGSDFDLCLNEICDIKVLGRCLKYWMEYTHGCIKGCLNQGVNHDVEYDDIPMFAEMLELVSRIYSSYVILNEE